MVIFTLCWFKYWYSAKRVITFTVFYLCFLLFICIDDGSIKCRYVAWWSMVALCLISTSMMGTVYNAHFKRGICFWVSSFMIDTQQRSIQCLARSPHIYKNQPTQDMVNACLCVTLHNELEHKITKMPMVSECWLCHTFHSENIQIEAYTGTQRQMFVPVHVIYNWWVHHKDHVILTNWGMGLTS